MPGTRCAIGRARTTGRGSCKIRATSSWRPAATARCARSRSRPSDAGVPFAALPIGTANNIAQDARAARRRARARALVGRDRRACRSTSARCAPATSRGDSSRASAAGGSPSSSREPTRSSDEFRLLGRETDRALHMLADLLRDGGAGRVADRRRRRRPLRRLPRRRDPQHPVRRPERAARARGRSVGRAARRRARDRCRSRRRSSSTSTSGSTWRAASCRRCDRSARARSASRSRRDAAPRGRRRVA